MSKSLCEHREGRAFCTKSQDENSKYCPAHRLLAKVAYNRRIHEWRVKKFGEQNPFTLLYNANAFIELDKAERKTVLSGLSKTEADELTTATKIVEGGKMNQAQLIRDFQETARALRGERNRKALLEAKAKVAQKDAKKIRQALAILKEYDATTVQALADEVVV